MADARLARVVSQLTASPAAAETKTTQYTLSTHVLNTATGYPGRNVTVDLDTKIGSEWKRLSAHATNDDGRVKDFPKLPAGIHRLTFGTSAYFAASNTECFYPAVQVEFKIADGPTHYHVPLLISPFGFSTYRGS